MRFIFEAPFSTCHIRSPQQWHWLDGTMRTWIEWASEFGLSKRQMGLKAHLAQTRFARCSHKEIKRGQARSERFGSAKRLRFCLLASLAALNTDFWSHGCFLRKVIREWQKSCKRELFAQFNCSRARPWRRKSNSIHCVISVLAISHWRLSAKVAP